MSIRPFRDIKRKKTKEINVGNVKIGGQNPISVQSMTNTLTKDIKNTNDGILCKEWFQLNNMMTTNNGIIRPVRFIEVLQNYAKSTNKVLFTGFLQNDIQEFFLLLITVLHNRISRKN